MKFPFHKAGLYLTHNSHKDIYDKLYDYIDDKRKHFKTEEAIQRSLATNELWELQWYPNTPIGFFVVCAPTLEECLSYALEVEAEEDK